MSSSRPTGRSARKEESETPSLLITSPSQSSGPEEAVPAHKIEWNHALEDLLCEEAEKAQGLAWLHNKSELLYSKRSDVMQVCVIVLSTLSGSASVGSASLFGGDAMASVGIGGVSILVGILGTINSYFGWAKRAEGHRLGHNQYSSIHRAIHIEMSLPRDQRQQPKAMLKLVKEELARLADTLPRIPDCIIKEYKEQVGPTPQVRHPDITNGVHAMKPYSVIKAATPVKEPLSPGGIKIRVMD